jgi:hypothetical protein
MELALTWRISSPLETAKVSIKIRAGRKCRSSSITRYKLILGAQLRLARLGDDVLTTRLPLVDG